MQTAVGTEQSELAPSLINICRGCIFKSTDVMTPEAESSAGQRKSAAQGFCHGGIACRAVASPVCRELLSSHCGRTGKQYRLAFSSFSLQQLKYCLVIQESIIIMHFHRIRAVIVGNIFHRNSLTKVCLKAVHTHIQQSFQLALIPFHSFRVGEVHQAHACLPHIGLPHIPVGFFHQITVFHALCKQRGFLSDIGVNPYTDFQPTLVVTFQHALRVRKGFRIPYKVTPLKTFHPETVKMEHMQRNISVCHALDKAAGGFLIIIGGKGCSQPEAKRPGRRQCRFSGQFCILLNGSLWGMSVNHIVVQTLAFHGKLNSFYFLTGNFIGSISLIVQKNTVSFIGNIERNILIRNLTGCTAVLVPHIHHLSVFHERSKSFSKTINILVYINSQGIYGILSSCFII